MQVHKKLESKLLDRTYVEVAFDGKSPQLSRKEAVGMIAEEMKVGPERVGIIGLDHRSGTTEVIGRFNVYGSEESKKRLHPRYLETRLLTKVEREKLKQEEKKAKTQAPAQATEGKK